MGNLVLSRLHEFHGLDAIGLGQGLEGLGKNFEAETGVLREPPDGDQTGSDH